MHMEECGCLACSHREPLLVLPNALSPLHTMTCNPQLLPYDPQQILLTAD